MPLNAATRLLGAWCAAAIVPEGALAQASFEPLGYVRPGAFNISAARVSGDGRLAVLTSIDKSIAFQLHIADPSGGVRTVGPPPGHAGYFIIVDASRDGQRLPGWSGEPFSPYYAVPMVWSAGAGYLAPDPLGGQIEGWFAAISADGSTAVGDALFPWGYVAVSWRVGERELVPLSFPPGATDASASGVSGDGRIIMGAVGWARQHSASVRWRDGKVEVLEALPPPGAVRAYTQHLTPDARWALASIGLLTPRGEEYTRAGLYSDPTGYFILPGQDIRTHYHYGFTADARVVVGQRLLAFPESEAILWDPIHGFRTLWSILRAANVNLLGWQRLEGIADVSDDGTVVVGGGTNAAGGFEPFRAVIPPLCLADCDGSGVIDVADLLCFLSRSDRAQDPAANPVDFLYADLTNDSAIDFNDFLEFLNLYNRGECP